MKTLQLVCKSVCVCVVYQINVILHLIVCVNTCTLESFIMHYIF